MTTLHDTETAAAATRAGSNPEWAWSKESERSVERVEPDVDRHLIGRGDLAALTVNQDDHAEWRYVAPFIGLAALTASVVIVVAVNPVAVSGWVSPPQPVTITATATVASPPVTQTATKTMTVAALPTTVTAPPVTETAAAPVPGPQVFLADMRDQGWKDTPDHELANGRAACSDLAGPPKRTVLDVAKADSAYDHIPLPLVESFIVTAAVDLCPQNR